jgi:hypothetical protein
LNGTLINGPLWTSGKYGGSLAFDGANDYVSMGDVAQADGLTSVTVSAWVKFAVNGGGASETHLVDKSHCSGHTNGGPWELGVSLTSSRKAEFLIYPQGGSPAAYVFSGPSSTSIDDGAWHHVTGRYDGSQISIWVDGVQENSRPLVGVTMPNTSYGVELGGRCNGYAYPFRGVLDDVRIYTRALTPSEISADMATTVGAGASPQPDATAPSTPTGLASSNVTSSQIGLAWQASTDNVGVTGYRVYRNGSLVATTTATNHTSTGLSSNTSYVFTVAAFDAASNTSTQSNPLAVTTAASSTGSYTTNFNLTENPISEGGRWHGPNGTGFTNVRTANGNAFGTNGVTDTYDDSYAYMTGFTNDHEVEAVIHRGTVPNFNHEVELHLRVSESGGETYLYEILFNKDGAFQVVRWNGWRGGGGSYDITDLTSIGTGPGHSSAPANGDTVRARIVGQTITVWYNGSQIWTYTDNDAAKLTTGNPGIGFFYRPGATPSAFGFQSVTVRAL